MAVKWFRSTVTLFACALVVAGTAHAQEINFEFGVADEELRKQIRSVSLAQSLAAETDATAQDFVAAARADYRRILTALYAAGYYGPEISIRIDGREASGIAPLDAPNQVSTIDISVRPGSLFSFGKASVTPLPSGGVLPEEFAQGAIAKSDAIRQSAFTAITAWRDIGHAKADVAGQDLKANHQSSTLDAVISIAPGPRLSFGRTVVQGHEDVRAEAILRIAGLPQGEVYSPQDIKAAESRLRRTGAFETANATESESIDPDNSLPITLTVAESKPRRFGFGLELSTIEGLTVSSFWMHRNAFGGAERFRLDGEVSGIGGETGGTDYTLTSSLAVPAIYGPETDFLASFSLSREDEPTYEIDKISADVRLTRNLTEDLTGNVGFGLLHAKETTSQGNRNYTLLTLPLGIEWDKRDDATSAKNGYYLDLDASPFIGLEGIDNGARVFADARAYRSFGSDQRLTFAARGMFGSLLGADANDAPADFLFFSGGGGTVRGQPYKTLGVIDGSDLRGGSSFAGAQLETRYDVSESLGLVGFYDFGHVGETATPLESGRWHAGTGIGLRYNTGIGPIRLDVGTPASGDDAFDAVQLYIGIGQAF